MRRRRVTLLAAGLVTLAAVATATATAGNIAVQSAKNSDSHAARASLMALPSCPTATICAFTGANGTGTQENFPTSSYHSAWINFTTAAGFHPESIIDNSGSDIWMYDQQAAQSGDTTAGPYCAFGTSLRSYTFTGYQPGWFFIQYNVNTCATQPPAPPS
jgi:hypothetical protein